MFRQALRCIVPFSQLALKLLQEFPSLICGVGLPLREAEVMDVDEAAFRQGHLSAELYGYLLSPFEPHLIQGNKMASPMTENEVENQAAIAIYVIEEMKTEIIYIIGPGTTTRTIGDLLDQKKTLLGVDLFQEKKISSERCE